jgi:hypothetical protein
MLAKGPASRQCLLYYEQQNEEDAVLAEATARDMQARLLHSVLSNTRERDPGVDVHRGIHTRQSLPSIVRSDQDPIGHR